MHREENANLHLNWHGSLTALYHGVPSRILRSGGTVMGYFSLRMPCIKCAYTLLNIFEKRFFI